ncbi:Hypothetical protein, putative [Bodo saltans]|uniref:RNA-editing substrate-binding complex 5 protein domain-containing protein n=1 Tax=Bodo saltans TaxID=75058 RepID=A0A0S4INL4_BODSA|nr:Hypothetical protein, putative [Bodo saltans]|eukprot:CUF68527.1 Hypothetical protein, putative [Bodo saltans]
MRRLIGRPLQTTTAVVASIETMVVWSHRVPSPSSTTSSSTASSSFSSSSLSVQRRGYVNAFFRPPLRENIPTHAPNGEEVDPDEFLNQFRQLFFALKQSQLIENYYEMKPLPYLDASFAPDVFASMKSVVFAMPKYGREHRSSEMSETLRYLRGSGANNDFNPSLQAAKGAVAHGGDFVATTHGMLVGYGAQGRTNQIAINVLSGGEAERSSDSDVAVQGFSMADAVELMPDAPPLGDLLAFAGSRTMLARNDTFGVDAAMKATRQQNKVPWQVVKVDPGCHVLSFAAGSLPVYDVICDADFPDTMDRLAEAGLNPFPVKWTEPRKLGMSMRSFCLVVRFSISAGPGGFRDSMGHKASERNYTPSARRSGPKSRWVHEAKRTYGDQGAPLLAQLRAGEIPDPVSQPPPRYRPPMHRAGGLTTTHDTTKKP